MRPQFWQIGAMAVYQCDQPPELLLALSTRSLWSVLQAAQASAVSVDLLDQLAQHRCRPVVFDLAGARRIVTTAAVLQHQLTNVGLAAPVEDRFASGKHGVLFLHAHSTWIEMLHCG